MSIQENKHYSIKEILSTDGRVVKTVDPYWEDDTLHGGYDDSNDYPFDVTTAAEEDRKLDLSDI